MFVRLEVRFFVGQVTIYIDDETEKKMAAAAEAMQMSKSKWVSTLVREKILTEWPASVVDLAGAWKDFPAIDEIRSGQGCDATREQL